MVLCDNYRKGTSPATGAIRDYHQFDWPAQDYNNVGIYTGCGPESFGSWYPVTNAWGGIYFVVVYEAKEYGHGFTTLGSLE